MSVTRFSTRALIASVAFIGVSFVALQNANHLWATVFTSAVILVFFVSLVATIYRRDSQRAFWIGFCIFGWGYLTIIYGWVSLTGGNLVTTTILWQLAELFHGSDAPDLVDSGRRFGSGVEMQLGLRNVQVAPDANFLRIGHSIWALLFASIGGLTARAFHETSTEIRSAAED